MRIREALYELLAIICIFGSGYGLMLIGYAAGF